MNNEKYTPLELSILIFFLINSFSSITILKLFKDFSTIEILLTFIITIVLGYLLIKILLMKYKDDYLNNLSKNKTMNIIIKIIFLICITTTASYIIFNLSTIIQDVLLPNTSIKLIILVFLILSTILAYKGLKSISIASNLFFLIYLLVIIISFIFNLFNVNSINLLPISINIKNINFFELLIYTSSPIFLTLIIPKKEIINYKKYTKYIKRTYIISILYILIKILFIISILGTKYYSVISYPEINILKMINIFNFFERLEELLIISIFIECLIVSSLSIRYIYEIVKDYIKIKNKNFIIIDLFIFLLLININELNNNILLITQTIFILINIFINQKK